MTDVVIPVKTLAQAKGRLQNVLCPADRAKLVLAMLHDLLSALHHCDVGAIWLVASDDRVFDLGRQFGATAVRESSAQGYNHAVATGLRSVASERAVMVLPADIPLINPRDIAHLLGLASQGRPTVGIVPDRQMRGTNGLYLSSPDLIEPTFGRSSFFDHKVAATRASCAAQVVVNQNMAMDIDCPADLFALAGSARSNAAVRFLKTLPLTQPSTNSRKRGVA